MREGREGWGKGRGGVIAVGHKGELNIAYTITHTQTCLGASAVCGLHVTKMVDIIFLGIFL